MSGLCHQLLLAAVLVAWCCLCVCVCCAGATAAERARGSLYVIARELNPQRGPSSSTRCLRCLRHARGDASGDRPVKLAVIFCLRIKSWRKRLKAVQACQCVHPVYLASIMHYIRQIIANCNVSFFILDSDSSV